MHKKRKASPHSSGNSHGGLYATMPAEDALGTAWHGRAACETAAQTQGALSPAHALWNK